MEVSAVDLKNPEVRQAMEALGFIDTDLNQK
jgi:hypothetical protein